MRVLKTKIDIVLFIAFIIENKDDKEKLNTLIKEYRENEFEII